MEANILPRKSIFKSKGTNLAERYLGYLGNKTFLSLWSNLCVYNEDGKELCDLLVVFGNDILIFSDKNCKFNWSDDVNLLQLGWNRWFKRAVEKSANQLLGAERCIRKSPKLFLDSKLTIPFHLGLPDFQKADIHLILVAHGISEYVKKFFGNNGTGSLLIDSSIKGIDQHKNPFYIGDLYPNKTFIHVLDDESLEILMGVRDTAPDLITYLKKRRTLLRGETKIIATGEEELLSIYLKNLNKDNEHDFIFFNEGEEREVNRIALSEGGWEDFQKNPQRIAQIEADKISYIWDSLIETFNKYAIEGKQYFVSGGGVKDTERVLRFMAAEPRFMRRYFSLQIKNAFENTSKNQRRLRVFPSNAPGCPYYVFLLFPTPKNPKISYDEYRRARQQFLTACCMVTKLKYKEAKHIVGIATESGFDKMGRSEDACYLNVINWTKEMDESAKEAQTQFNILQNPDYHHTHIDEYPEKKIEHI